MENYKCKKCGGKYYKKAKIIHDILGEGDLYVCENNCKTQLILVNPELFKDYEVIENKGENT